MKTFSPTEGSDLINEYSHWCRPIVAGVMTALIVGLLLDLLVMSVGFASFSPTKGVLYLLSIGAIVWLLVVSVSSMYAGGWVAGYFSAGTSSKTGIFYGLMVSFSSILILLALTLTAFGVIVSGSLNVLQGAIPSLYSTITEGTSAVNKLSKEVSKISPELSEKFKRAVPDLKPVIDEINQKAAELLPEQNELNEFHENGTNTKETTSEKHSDNAKTRLGKLIANYLNSIADSENEEARNELINSLSEISGKSQPEISQKVDEWQKLYLEAKEKMRQATINLSKDIAKTVSQLALLNFFILLSGIVAAVVGGLHGIKKRDAVVRI